MSRIDLVINSVDRSHGTPSDFSIQLHRAIKVKAIKLKRSIIPNTIHTINANNQILRVQTANAASETVTVDVILTAANYTASELATHVSTLLTASAPGTYTVTKSATDTSRFNFSCSQGFQLMFDNQQSPYKELGFFKGTTVTSEATSATTFDITAPSFYKLGYDYLLLQSRGLQSNMETTTGLSCFAQLPLNANSGGYAYNSEDYDGEHQIYETQKILNQLDFRLITPQGQLCDFNGIDVSFVFEVTH